MRAVFWKECRHQLLSFKSIFFILLFIVLGVSLEQLLTQTCTKDGVLNESHGPYYRGMVIENADTLYLTREELDLLTHYRKAEADDRRLVQKVLGMDLPG